MADTPYTGDEGDEAIAAGFPVPDGTEDWRDGWRSIAKSRDIIATVRTDLLAQIAGITPTSLGIPGWTPAATPSTIVQRNTTGKAQFATPTGASDAATKGYVDGAVGGIDLSSRVAKTGDTMSGQLWLPASFAASSGYTIGYIDGDGRVSRGASSERYKDDITLIDPAALGAIFPDLYSFRMKGHDTPRVGWIAERLMEHPDLMPFVVFQRVAVFDDDGNMAGYAIATDHDGNPIAESIDFISLLIAQNSRQAQQITEQDAAITELRALITGGTDAPPAK